MTVATDINPDDLCPLSAICCYVSSIYTKFPDCIGCQGKNVCLCLDSEFLAFKLLKPDGRDDVFMICQEAKCYIIQPKTCCKIQTQCFIFDTRGALPFDAEVPQLCTICGATLYHTSPGFKGCCATLKEIKGGGAPAEPIGGAPVTSAEMER
uniref:Uncharacterized protein n=1 Tax=Rhizochromulina marina TaxID=1034831 RepID=A0A7S2WRI7_9STRA|mmetsp:Transcript_31201/g.90688  ORF Transcript_31201/g.90688 Transcript_31201/m.90688 type:complete len:152 (+) Transcript_31201:72-527(+)